MINGKHIFKIFLRVYCYTSIHGLFHFVNFFTKKKKKDGGEKFPFHFQTFDHSRVCGRFLQDFERNLNISFGSRDIGSRNSRTDTSPTSAFVPCSCVSRKKRRKEKRKGKKIEKRRRKIALHATFWQIYITYLWKIHVSRANLRRKFYFYSIYFFSFHPKLKNRTKFAKKQL